MSGKVYRVETTIIALDPDGDTTVYDIIESANSIHQAIADTILQLENVSYYHKED